MHLFSGANRPDSQLSCPSDMIPPPLQVELQLHALFHCKEIKYAA
jgi:hypothetical protein